MTTETVGSVVFAGGVAANSEIREKVAKFCDEENLGFYVPPVSLCSDNAAMIAWAAIERIKAATHTHLSTPKQDQNGHWTKFDSLIKARQF
ncbi:hypothetical protein FACS1894113_5210 [Alphaproteobacteria bacterium]|nr:hypothetical protein FACS1894113_5210 [Alphaproteobacteria bacterium]